MKYSIEKTEKYVLFQLHDEKLTSLSAPELKSEFVTLNAEGFRNIILDLADVKYTDSSGLSSILVANRICNNAGGIFVMARVSDHVLKLLTISQLDSILTILPSVEEAVDAVFMHELENNLRGEGEEA
jgi:anti-sigma B factor antagonist